MYIKLLLITLAFVAVAFMLMAIRMLVVRGGKFPNTSVSGNRHLRQMGITCAKCDEQAKFNRMHRKKIKVNPFELKVINN
jgi:hypothetical protein